jgi:SHAQKYF class myb-like DNA-binding protein
MQGYELVQDRASTELHAIFSCRPQKQSSCKKYFWSDQEHLIFVKLQDKYGKDWKLISEQIEGRTHQQVRTHAQKYHTSLLTLKKDAL